MLQKRFENIYVQNYIFPLPTKFFDLVWRTLFIFLTLELSFHLCGSFLVCKINCGLCENDGKTKDYVSHKEYLDSTSVEGICVYKVWPSVIAKESIIHFKG